MGNVLQRQKYFDEHNIDPYKILDVTRGTTTKNDIKRQYKKKALKLHPDKTGGKTDLEFRILKECYNHIIEDIEFTTTKDFTQLKNLQNEEEVKVDPEEFQDYRNFHRINFSDSNVRQNLFVDDDLDFSNIDTVIKEKAKNPVSYGSVKKISHKDIFDGKKFDIHKFNAAFDIQNPELVNSKTESTQEPEALEAYSSLNSLPISTYKGLIIEQKNLKRLDYQRYIPNETEGTEPAKPISELSPKQVEKLVKQKKKELNELLNTRKNEKVEVDTRLSYLDAEAKMFEDRMVNMKAEMARNRDIVAANSRIYPKSSIEQFNKGLLADSSTCISELSSAEFIPTGIRQ